MTDPTIPTTPDELDWMASDFIDRTWGNALDWPMTDVELEKQAKGYIELKMADDLGPGPMTDAELEQMAKDFNDQTNWADNLDPSLTPDTYLANHLYRLAASALFLQQLHAHQRQHQISALIEESFDFPLLDYTTTQQQLGKWLEPLGHDVAQLRRTAKRLGQEFKALADGAGASWLRYRLVDFETEHGTRAWRYVRGWDAIDMAVQQADSAELNYGLGVELEELGVDDDVADQAAIELITWIGEYLIGDFRSFLLVRSDVAPQLDGPDAWWGDREDSEED